MGGLGSVAAASGGLCCRDCFKVFYVHKFRAVLGKNRLIFPGEKVEYGVISMWDLQLDSPYPQALILCPYHPSHRWLVPATSHQPLPLPCTLALNIDPWGCPWQWSGGGQAHVGDAVTSNNVPFFQVLLAWSGGPSSSSMVWQVLEVRLHSVLLGPGCCPTMFEGGGSALRGSCLEIERIVHPELGILEGSRMFT